jgi:type IX secretion system PorP/SprF family membrane protein
MKRIVAICLASFTSAAWAQQIPSDNQYLINRFSLSPAYAGHGQSFEAFTLYRHSWVGIPNGPKVKGVNVNGGIGRNMGIGASITNDQAGIFNNFSGSLAYSYNVNLTNTQSLRFGLSAGFFENYLDMSNTRQQDLMDPVVVNNQTPGSAVFDAGAGLLYINKGIHAGIAVPRLLESEAVNDGGNTVYTLKRHYVAHLSYIYPLNRLWKIEPVIIGRKASSGPLLLEASALVKYMGQFWLGAGYKSNSSAALSAGFLYKRIAMNYTYEFASSGIAAASSGTHELSLGILIGKNRNSYSSIFYSESKQAPYYNWIEKKD